MLCAAIMMMSSVCGQSAAAFAAENTSVEAGTGDTIQEDAGEETGAAAGTETPEGDSGEESGSGTSVSDDAQEEEPADEEDAAEENAGDRTEDDAAEEDTDAGRSGSSAQGGSGQDGEEQDFDDEEDASDDDSSPEEIGAGTGRPEDSGDAQESWEDEGSSDVEEEDIDEEAGQEDGEDPADTLLPVEEKQAALILYGYTETSLKQVKFSYIRDHLQDPDGNYYNFKSTDTFMWTYFKDEYGQTIRDEYHKVTSAGTVDMSVFEDDSAGYKMELLVGDGTQLGQNTRYIVNVYLTNGISEFNTLSLYTEDAQGRRAKVDAQRLKYTESGSEFYVPGHVEGTEYYLAINSEIINHPNFNVEVYTEEEYEKREESGWKTASPITDRIVNPNMNLPGAGYPATFDAADARTFVVVVESPETHHEYLVRSHKVVVKGSSIYVDSAVWTRESGRLIRSAVLSGDAPDWSLYSIRDDANGVENQFLMLGKGDEENEEFYIVLTAHHSLYGDQAADHITGTYAGSYASPGDAAGQTDITGKLFADPGGEAFAGYAVDKAQLFRDHLFTVFWDDGTVCRINVSVSRFNNSQDYTRWQDYYAQPVVGEKDPWFRVTGVKLGDRELEAYVVENGGARTLDTYYGKGFQTIFVNEYLSPADLKSLKPVFWLADSSQIRLRTNVNGGQDEVSGVSAHDFTAPVDYYALFEGRQKNYKVEIIPKVSGPKLYVFGRDGTEYERNREIFLDEYYDYRHDILIANVGDRELTGLNVSLRNASHVRIDDYWTVGGSSNDTLQPFTTAEVTAQKGELQNLAKIRLVSDGKGTISGDLVISADGQQDVVIHLSGSAIQPVIRTKSLTDAVKFVPYSYIISTSNMNDRVDVTYELRGKLPAGMSFDSKTGELYGVPRDVGTFSFTVKAYYSDAEFETSSVELSLKVLDNEDETVFKTSDEGYEIVPEENGESGYFGRKISDYRFELDLSQQKEMFISNGEFVQFEKLWLNGQELRPGIDYVAEPGSTRLSLFIQAIRDKFGKGRNTISAQYRVSTGGGSGDGGGSGGSTGGSDGSGSSGDLGGGGGNTGGWTGGGSTIRRTSQNFVVREVTTAAIKEKTPSASAEPTTISIYVRTNKIYKNKYTKLTARTNSKGKLKWTSSNRKVATVSSTGKVKGVGKGNCTITVTTADGKKASCKMHVMIPVKSIRLTRKTLNLKAGKSSKLKLKIKPTNVDKSDLVWKSSNTKVAVVNSKGKVTAIRKGTCKITVRAPNGKKAVCKVKVTRVIPVKKVIMSRTGMTLDKGSSAALTAAVRPKNASTKTIKWSSSNPGVATVDKNGKVTGINQGTARITARSNNGKRAVCTVTVRLVPVSSVALKLNNLILGKGSSTALGVTILPANASNKTVTWSSSNPAVATVSNGVIRGVNGGKAVITVRSSNGRTSSCTVTVTEPMTALPMVSMSKSQLSLLVGRSTTLTASLSVANLLDNTITWESTRPSVATVSGGKLTAVKAGYTTVIARSAYNTVATCSVMVTAPVVPAESVTLDRTELILNPGFNDQKTAELTATVLPVSATDRTVTWTSSNEEVATVKKGKVAAVAEGTAQITATTSNGLKAVCNVTVEVGAKRIRTVEDLKAINNDLRASYILENDIDLSGENWTPIGGGTNGFYGSFDGNGYAITGMTITRDSVTVGSFGPYASTGLFNVCRGTIKNLTVSGTIEADSAVTTANIGGISGCMDNGSIINCVSNVEIIGSNSGGNYNAYTYAGGIVGEASGGVIRDCVNHGNVGAAAGLAESNIARVGGIVGDLVNSAQVNNCSNTGTVLSLVQTSQTDASVNASAGGIVGHIDTGGRCRNSSNSGAVYAQVIGDARTSDYGWAIAGGVAGDSDSGYVSGCSGCTDVHASSENASVSLMEGEVIGSEPTSELSLSKTEMTLYYGQSQKLTGTVIPSDSSSPEIVWFTGDESIATVGSDGTVTAVSYGDTTIKGRARIGGASATCTVKVRDPNLSDDEVSKIRIYTGGSTTLGVNKTLQLGATALPETALDKTITWSSSDESVATVDQTGKVSTLNAGEVQITATAVNGINSSITVKVLRASLAYKNGQYYSCARGEILPIDVTVNMSGGFVPGTYEYIMYIAYYDGGWNELASFNIDGSELFEERYTGKASVVVNSIVGEQADVTINIDTAKLEKISGKLMSISIFPYNNFTTGASLCDEIAVLTVN